jgi:type I restriction-modification system DNA methylase subunit
MEKGWDKLKNKDANKIKFKLWQEHMEIVYGDKPSFLGFIEQTYLIILVKLIVYLRIIKNKKELNILDVLNGEYFKSFGLSNLSEEGYYSWITSKECYSDIQPYITALLKEISFYNLEDVNEDLFKELYKDIVKKEDRHRVGEYYTPEWLSKLTLEETLKYFKESFPGKIPSVLDPACGSGTFLTNYIHILKKELSSKPPLERLNIIINKVVGADINPLAVSIARANYVFALGDLLSFKEDMISIPIYVSDTFRLHNFENDHSIEFYKLDAAGKNLQIPKTVLNNPEKYKQLIKEYEKIIITYIQENRNRDISLKIFEKNKSLFTEDEWNIIINTLNTLFNLINEEKNSVWIFILSNTLAPIHFTLNKFDVIIGNPPWISMRYVENLDYQNYIKQRVLEYKLINSTDIQLFSNMEMATVFYNNCIDNYLMENSYIGFVMPRSIITGALQHVNFKLFNNPLSKLRTILDFEDVTPLFNIPSCTIISKNNEPTIYPVPLVKYSGKLPNKNMNLDEASKYLIISQEDYSPSDNAGPRSFYYNLFKMGARLAPRPFFFISFDTHSEFGFNPKIPKIFSTNESVKSAKGDWKKVKLIGSVESNYIYCTLLSRDVLPFGIKELRVVVLPLIKENNELKLLNKDELYNRGDINAAKWFESVEKYWKDYGSAKSKGNFPSIIDRINYQNLLVSQNINRKYILIYAKAGKYLVCSVLNRDSIPDFVIGNTKIKPIDFIVESDTWFFMSDNEYEVHYLCSILNCEFLNKEVRKKQTKGLWGERDIHRRPLTFNIPQFDSSNIEHTKLAEISKKQHEIVKKIGPNIKEKSITGPRLRIRKIIARDLKEIDKIVQKIIDF